MAASACLPECGFRMWTRVRTPARNQGDDALIFLETCDAIPTCASLPDARFGHERVRRIERAAGPAGPGCRRPNRKRGNVLAGGAGGDGRTGRGLPTPT